MAKSRHNARTIPPACPRAARRHPNFPRHWRIFATLGRPDAQRSMMRLTPEYQVVITAAPQRFPTAQLALRRLPRAQLSRMLIPSTWEGRTMKHLAFAFAISLFAA